MVGYVLYCLNSWFHASMRAQSPKLWLLLYQILHSLLNNNHHRFTLVQLRDIYLGRKNKIKNHTFNAILHTWNPGNLLYLLEQMIIHKVSFVLSLFHIFIQDIYIQLLQETPILGPYYNITGIISVGHEAADAWLECYKLQRCNRYATTPNRYTTMR